MKITTQSLDEFMIDQFQSEPTAAIDLLQSCFDDFLQTGDATSLHIFYTVLRQIAIAKGGIANLSQQTGLSRESLYKSLSPNKKPRFETIVTILKALGISLHFNILLSNVTDENLSAEISSKEKTNPKKRPIKSSVKI